MLNISKSITLNPQITGCENTLLQDYFIFEMASHVGLCVYIYVTDNREFMVM